MARITWRDRSNSGADSAISASIFNDIKSSVNTLYTELENVVNLSGSANQRGGSSKYITPIAVYNPNDIDQFLDFSSDKFDFFGNDVDIREDLRVRGNIIANGTISGSGARLQGLNIPGGGLKVGTNSVEIYGDDDLIKLRHLTSLSGDGEIDTFGTITEPPTLGGVQINFVDTAVALPPPAPPNQFPAASKIEFSLDNIIPFEIFQNKIVIDGEVYIETAGDIPQLSSPTDSTRVLVHDTNDGGRLKFIPKSELSGGGGGGLSFQTASLVGPSSQYDSIGGPFTQITASANNKIIRFEPIHGLFMGMGNSPLDGSPRITIGTGSIFTASWAHNVISASHVSSAFYRAENNGTQNDQIKLIRMDETFVTVTINNVESSSYADTSSFALIAYTASHVDDALYSASIDDATITYHQFDGGTFVHTVNNVESSSYAETASYTQTPTWNEVLTEGKDANQFVYINGNNKIILGTTSDSDEEPASIYSDSGLKLSSDTKIVLDPDDNVGISTNSPTEMLDINGNLRVRGAVSASVIPENLTENTVVLWDGDKLVRNEFSTLLDANTFNAYATASFGDAGEIIATSATSAFQFGFENGLSGSIQSNILTIGTSSAFSASYALTAITSSYITADNIDQPFSVLEVTGDITASFISASTGITSSDVYIDEWGSVSASLAAAVNSNDNLGNHTAEEDLNLANFDIFGVTNITASNEISASGGFIGDLTGTASYADLATTASYVTSSNVHGPHGFNSVLSSSYAITSSYSVSSSHAELADQATTATTASHALGANTSLTASHVDDALYSASIADATITYHQFDGGTFVHTVNNVNDAVSSSYASTSSWAINAYTASHVDNALYSASINGATITYHQFDGDTFVHTVDNVINATSASYASTASYVQTAQTASYVDVNNIDGTIDISDQTNLAAGTNLSLDNDTINLDSNISLNSVTASILGNLDGTASYADYATSASHANNANSSLTASYFDIEFSSNTQGVLTASINGVDQTIGLGVQTTNNVQFANFTATGNTIKLTGVPNSTSVLTPLVIDSDGCIYTGSAYTAYTPSGDIDGFYAGADSGGSIAIGPAGTLSIIGNLDTPGITTSIAGTGGSATLKIGLSNILSSSAQIATDISGAFNYSSSIFSSDISDLQDSASAGVYFGEFGNFSDGFTLTQFETASFDAQGGDGLVLEITGQNILYKLVGVLSSSQQIATDISGAIDAATGSVLNDYGLLSSSQQIATEISGAINAATSSVLNDYSLISSSQQIATDISGAISAATSSVLNNYNLLSSSQQIATEITGAFQPASASFATDITNLESSASAGIFFYNTDSTGFNVPLMGTASFTASGNAYDSGNFNIYVSNDVVNYELDFPHNLLSGSQQIATDISGAINLATSSILNDYGLISGSVDVNQNAFSTASIFGNTDLEIISTNTVDNLIFEAGPNIFLSTGSTGTIYISASTDNTGDNLGNHIAEQNLIMGDGIANFDIRNVNDITVRGDIKLLSENKISFDGDNDNTYIAANSDNPEDLTLHADGDILLNPDGNVGIDISSTSPSEKLTVGGKVRATHFLATGGTGASPSFAFAGDPDTGLFRPAPSNIALQINGSTVEFSLNETTGASLSSGMVMRGDLIVSNAIGSAVGSNISASGYLQSHVPNRETVPASISNQVVLYDTSSGRFYYTGSYGGGGTTTTTGTGDADVLTLNDNTSNLASIGTIETTGTHTYMRAEFYAKSSTNIVQAARTVFIWDQTFGHIHTTTVEDIRTDDTVNLFNINSVSGSWDSNGNIRVYLTQYNDLTVDYKFRYILI